MKQQGDRRGWPQRRDARLEAPRREPASATTPPAPGAPRRETPTRFRHRESRGAAIATDLPNQAARAGARPRGAFGPFRHVPARPKDAILM